ncbi:unnamed protein product [Dovyalis caffra]|uniref:Glucose-methanol-choline oxidoreductase N-terminal domain-containing protein n=1 Tax=Dovyalis caffra TaxID=77055 RepID=A0AAV1RM11_9ROSI|nr:unnamed protein product [Dovyalis caffra]
MYNHSLLKQPIRKMEIPHIFHGCGFALVFLVLLANLSTSSSLSQGKSLPYMTSNVEEISGKSFDYIILGGGTAGCALAATLSEKFSVLVLERGGSPYGNIFIKERKFMGFSLLQTDEFSSVAQSFTPKEGVLNHRGRVLGGSSAINFGFYSRASSSFVSRVGWDKKLVKEAFEWVESRIVFKPNKLTRYQTAVKYGFLDAGIRPYNGFTWEHLTGTKIGGSLFDNHGTRHSSADLLQEGNPNNVVVLLNATAKSIIFRGQGKGSIVHGIRFIKSHGSTKQTYEAYLNQTAANSSPRGDVILSAGAIDLEGVGQEMTDNPRIDDTVNVKLQASEPAQVAGIVNKEFRFLVEGIIAPSSFNASVMTLAIKIAFPESRGKLELNNTDPRQNPLVEFNYLATKNDMEKCVEMVRLLERIANTKSLTRFRGAGAQNNVTTSNELRRFCEDRKNLRTFFHYHGGCKVGSVVDKDYKVYGIKGLRVVDGSTFLNHQVQTQLLLS